MNDFQRTQEWYLSRKGKITASEVSNILGKGKKKDELFSKTAVSYLNEKVAELLMDDEGFLWYMTDCKKSNAAMNWGNEYESSAREQYELATGRKVMDAPFQTLDKYEDYVGGSPDGRLSTLDGIIEIKCPYNPAVHIEHCKWNTPEDLQSGNLQYYAQVQMNMLITHTEYCDFISYSPLFRGGTDLHVLNVPFDPDFCATILERIKVSVGYIQEQMQLLLKS